MPLPSTTYRAASSFTRATPYAAWWIYTRSPDVVHLCAASPRAVLERVQQVLGRPRGNAWTMGDLEALRERALQRHREQPGQFWDLLAQYIRAEPRGAQRVVSENALRFALWLAYYAPAGLRFDALELPPSTELPVLDQPVPNVGGELLCWIPGTQTPPELLSPSQQLDAVRASTAGVRLAPGEDAPRPAPPVVHPRVGWSLGELAAGAAGLTGLVLLVRHLLRGADTPP